MQLSVIVPTYNRADLLPATLESVLAQTHPADEIIVVDDGSTDDTPAVLDAYDTHITAIRQANRGRSAARNRGVTVASGTVIGFLDSDDTLPPNSFAERLAALRDADADMVYSDAYLIDEEGTHHGRLSQTRPEYGSAGDLYPILCRQNVFPPSVALMKAKSLPPAPIFRAEYEPIEDYDLWLRMVEAGAQVAYVGQPVVNYRVHAGMSTQTETAAMRTNEKRIQRELVERPHFATLTAREQARVFVSHGIKYLMDGDRRAAQRHWQQARSLDATWPIPYGLLALSKLGVLRHTLAIRRRLRGDIDLDMPS